MTDVEGKVQCVFCLLYTSATMSDNGKYMMIYRDNKVTGDNPDEQNVQRKEEDVYKRQK